MAKRRVGRPVDADGERTRRTLVRIGGEHLSKYGYAKTTFRAIAEDAGLTEGAVYYYFPSKVALVEAVLVAVDEFVMPIYQQALADHRSFTSRVRQIFLDSRKVTDAGDIRALATIGNVLVMDGSRYADLMPAIDHWVARYEEFFWKLTVDAIEAGELEADIDVRAIVDLLRALIYGAAAISGSFTEERTRALAEVVGAVIEGKLQCDPTLPKR